MLDLWCTFVTRMCEPVALQSITYLRKEAAVPYSNSKRGYCMPVRYEICGQFNPPLSKPLPCSQAFETRLDL